MLEQFSAYHRRWVQFQCQFLQLLSMYSSIPIATAATFIPPGPSAVLRAGPTHFGLHDIVQLLLASTKNTTYQSANCPNTMETRFNGSNSSDNSGAPLIRLN